MTPARSRLTTVVPPFGSPKTVSTPWPWLKWALVAAEAEGAKARAAVNDAATAPAPTIVRLRARCLLYFMESPVLVGEVHMPGSTTRTRSPFEKPGMAKNSPQLMNRRRRYDVPRGGVWPTGPPPTHGIRSTSLRQ